MNPYEALIRCYDCGIRYVGEYHATTSVKDDLCPVCVARHCAPKRPSQHQTAPGVVTLLPTRT